MPSSWETIFTKPRRYYNMQKMIISVPILFVLVIIFSGNVNETFGLESNTDYFISSDSIYLIFEVGTSNENTLTEGGITIDDILYEFDVDQVQIWRVTNDGDYGRIFGKTLDGDYYYLIYDMNGFEGKLLLKIWTDGHVTKLIEDAEIGKLF